MIYVAVICKKLWERSTRDHGDWASFIDKNKNNVITKALKARNEWERKGYGPYIILVGTLEEEATIPANYELRPIDTLVPLSDAVEPRWI